MITIGEGIQSVQSMYSKGVQTRDTRLSPRQIYSELINARSTVLRNKSSKNQFIGEWSYQVLPCVELEKSTVQELDCVVDDKCVVLRSKYPLPKIIPDIEANLVKYVTSIDGSIRFENIDFQNTKYTSGNKYTSKKSRFYLRKGYLYITHRVILKGVTMEALFEDPIEVYNFPDICNNCSECKCKDYMDIELSVDRNTFDAITTMTYNTLLSMFLQMSEDKTNNSSDDSVSRMIHQNGQNEESDNT